MGEQIILNGKEQNRAMVSTSVVEGRRGEVHERLDGSLLVWYQGGSIAKDAQAVGGPVRGRASRLGQGSDGRG